MTTPFEQTWEPRHSPHACDELPRVVHGEETVLLVNEHTSASYERAVLDLASAAPELYRALAAFVDARAGGLRGGIVEDGVYRPKYAESCVTVEQWDAAVAALRKARGER